MRFRSANPVLRRVERNHAITSGDVATYTGVVMKSALMLGIMAIAGIFTFTTVMRGGTMSPWVIALVIASPIMALICVIVVSFSVRLAGVFSMIYAVCQGLFLGVISAIYEIMIGDFIVATALLATASVFAGMLFLYASGLIRVTEMFRRVLFTALLGLLFTSFALIIVSLFTPIFAEEGALTLLLIISVIAVIVASLYLLVDFDNITRVVASGADKRYEWTLSLGLMVTLVWLYVELLRLIALLRSRRR